MLHQKTFFFAFITLSSLGMIGCTKTIDGAKLEGIITSGIKEQTGLEVESVSCPEDRELKQGDVFSCDASLTGGQTFPVQVTQDDDQGNVTWDADEGLMTIEGLISSEKLEQQIAQGIAEQLNVEVTVDCGATYRIALKGETFDCTATDQEGTSAPVKIEAKDNEGNVRWSLNQ